MKAFSPSRYPELKTFALAGILAAPAVAACYHLQLTKSLQSNNSCIVIGHKTPQRLRYRPAQATTTVQVSDTTMFNQRTEAGNKKTKHTIFHHCRYSSPAT